MRSIFLILLGCLFSINLAAQLNAKVGYQYSYYGLGTTVHNDMIDQLNTNNNNTLEDYQEMDHIKGFHGLLLGARYRFEPVAVNVEMTSMFQRLKYEGEDTDGATEYKENYYGVVSYSAGLEFFVKRISFGGTLDLNRLRIRAETSDRADRHIILKENSISSHFFIGINLDGNEHLSLAIQPYVQIPWTNFDLTGLESQLNTGVNVDNLEDGFLNFGLRIIFQNGFYEN